MDTNDVFKVLDWYAEKAESIARYLAEGKTDAAMAVMTELSLDAGCRAKNYKSSFDSMLIKALLVNDKIKEEQIFGIKHLEGSYENQSFANG